MIDTNRSRQGLIYLIATVLAIVIGVIYNLSGVDILPPAMGFAGEYLSTVHGYGLIPWIVGVFGLIVAIYVVMRSAGAIVIGVARLIVWVGERFPQVPEGEDLNDG